MSEAPPIYGEESAFTGMEHDATGDTEYVAGDVA